MSFISISLLFFVIIFDAKVPTEGGSVPVGVKTPGEQSLAVVDDPLQQNEEPIPVQKETSHDFSQQKKKQLTKVMTTAGAVAAVLILMLILVNYAKPRALFAEKAKKVEKPKTEAKETFPLTLKEEEELQKLLEKLLEELEQDVKQEKDFAHKEEQIQKAEARRRAERIRILMTNYDPDKYTLQQRLDIAANDERLERLLLKPRAFSLADALD